MSIREIIQRNQRVCGAVAGVAVLAALGVSMRSLSGSEQPPRVERVFYSDDDGATYFVDNVDRLPPFDHDGKPAVRAHVFRCGHGGDAFVGYLEKVDDVTRAKLEQMRQAGILMREPNGVVPIDIAMLRDNGCLYKSPKVPADKWVKNGQPGADDIQHVKCPHTPSNAGDPGEILP